MKVDLEDIEAVVSSEQVETMEPAVPVDMQASSALSALIEAALEMSEAEWIEASISLTGAAERNMARMRRADPKQVEDCAVEDIDALL
jgi:hypothetical protein